MPASSDRGNAIHPAVALIGGCSSGTSIPSFIGDRGSRQSWPAFADNRRFAMAVLCRPAVAVPDHVVTMEETLELARRLHADHPQLPLALRLIETRDEDVSSLFNEQLGTDQR